MPSLRERWNALFRPNIINVTIGSDAPTQVLNYTAQKLYQTQDNLKAVVDFISNSIAQLPLKVYTRQGETQRVRDRDSNAAKLLWLPNEDQTEFEFIRAMMIEYLVFGTVYVWILPDADSPSGLQMRIIPSNWVIDREADTAYAPASIRVCINNGTTAADIPREEFVQFRTYSAGNPGGYLSPITALRQTLQEQIEAGNFRKQLWRSSGRLNAQIVRPANVQPWDDETRKKFITAFREAWGPGGSKAGSIPLLEDGMEIKPFSTSFKEAEWTSSVRLSREAVAAAYGINPSLVWHSDTQTYASAKDNARALYADCLGPILQMLQQRINSFLLPKAGASRETYVEFDLTEKLKGSFEERASIMQQAVGGPWMTRNEARADNNLPPIEGGDELIVPLNVAEGSQTPAESTERAQDAQTETERPRIGPTKNCDCAACKAAADEVTIDTRPEDGEVTELEDTLKNFFERQKKSVLPKLGAKAATWWDADRWNAELADDLLPHMNRIADNHGGNAAEKIGSIYDQEITREYLRVLTEARAKAINDKTYDDLEQAMNDDETEPADVYEHRDDYAEVNGRSLANTVAFWSLIEACHQAENQGVEAKMQKRWLTGPNPRPSHAAMNGQTVGIDEKFSNGADWPGDDNLSADETCGCNCRTEVIITF